MQDLVTEFTVTENHLKLLNHMYVYFYDGGYQGAPAVNLKRPYGNSYVAGDVYEIVTGKYPDDDLEEDVEQEMLKLHKETGLALQIVLCTGSFVPGLYHKKEKYNSTSWERVGPPLTVFEQEYSGESIVDLSRDIDECFSERYNTVMEQIPSDEYGFHQGTFKVTVEWSPE